MRIEIKENLVEFCDSIIQIGLETLLNMDLEEIKEVLKSSYNESDSYMKEQFHKDMKNIQKMKMILKENSNAFEEFIENPEFKEILEKILKNTTLL